MWVFSICDSRSTGSRALQGRPMYNTLGEDHQVHRTERRKVSYLIHTRTKLYG